MRIYRQPFSANLLREILKYYPSTGKWVWKVDVANHRKAGNSAGSLTKLGYWNVGIRGQSYKSSRLAWLYMTGKWPVRDVDHRNTKSSDDRWKNLRLATGSQNMWNRRQGKRLKGAYPVGKKFRAIIGYRYKIKHLGTFDTEKEAHLAYMKAARKYFGEFARAR